MCKIDEIITEGDDLKRRYELCIKGGMTKELLQKHGVRHEEANLWYEKAESALLKNYSDDSETFALWGGLKGSLDDAQFEAMMSSQSVLEGNLNHVSKCQQFLLQHFEKSETPDAVEAKPTLGERINKHPVIYWIGLIGSIASILALVFYFYDKWGDDPVDSLSDPVDSLSVPSITAKISNQSKDEVSILPRSDFFLWLPGTEAYHRIGKYQFSLDGSTPIGDESIPIQPQSTITLYAIILNQDTYGPVLQTEECDISLHVRNTRGKLKFTQNLPFTAAAIKKYFLSVQFGESEINE